MKLRIIYCIYKFYNFFISHHLSLHSFPNIHLSKSHTKTLPPNDNFNLRVNIGWSSHQICYASLLRRKPKWEKKLLSIFLLYFFAKNSNQVYLVLCSVFLDEAFTHKIPSKQMLKTKYILVFWYNNMQNNMQISCRLWSIVFDWALIIASYIYV